MVAPHFRAGVVIVIFGQERRAGQVLVFERSDVAGQWQFPQGGLDEGEAPVAAAWRELEEETGLGPADVTLRGEHPGWIAYEYPPDVVARKGRLGQAHRWYFFDALRPDITPTPDGSEFVAWQWVTPDWIIANAVEFRRPGYRSVLQST